MTLTQRSSPRFNNSQKSNEESCKEEKSVEEKENKTSTSLKRARYSEVSTILPKKNAITSNGAHTLNDLDNIISKFHATARPAALPCREEEFTEILGCLETSIDTSNGQCICIKIILFLIPIITHETYLEFLVQEKPQLFMR